MYKNFSKRIVSLIICCLLMLQINAQNYTGTWEGITDSDEFIQLNIVQIGTTICGYSWDYETSNKRSFCKANFSGSYYKDRKICYVEGYSFIQNSGTHVLMNIKFGLVYENGVPRLQGACQIKATAYSNAGPPSYFSLQKIAKYPSVITSGMRNCLPPEIEPIAKKTAPKIATAKKPIIKNPTNTKIPTKSANKIAISKKPVNRNTTTTKPMVKPTTVAKPPVQKPIAKVTPPIKKIDTVKNNKPNIEIVKKLTPKIVEIPKLTNGRANTEQSRITLTEKKINLSIYDNGTIDGDTVSVYFDNKLVVNKKRLSGNPISLDLELDESIGLHTLVVYAENLGTIPPNTALVILTTASGKRYELHSSATLEKNAALVFEYKPK